MCRPTHFDVSYSINPWMDPDKPTDTALAIAQWERLRELYLELGHQVELIEPLPGLPDMVFAANGATVVDGRVLVARFRHPERAAEARRTWTGSARTGYRGPRRAVRQRGRGRLPGRRRPGAGRHRVPHRPPRARRGRRSSSACPVIGLDAGRPALLPPGHRAGRARRRRDHVLPGGVLRGQPGGAATSCTRTRSAPPRRTPRRSGSTRSPTAGTSSLPQAATGLIEPAARRAASSRSASTCPNCSRPAAA